MFLIECMKQETLNPEFEAACCGESARMIRQYHVYNFWDVLCAFQAR